jgi:hypothetical protein
MELTGESMKGDDRGESMNGVDEESMNGVDVESMNGVNEDIDELG